MKDIEFNKNFIDAFMNNNASIILITNEEKIFEVNKSFLEFFEINKIEEFISSYSCISNLFIEGEGLIESIVQGIPWKKYLLKYPKEVHKVVLIQKGIKYYFSIKIIDISNDELNRLIIVLDDITQNELMKERYEYSLKASNEGIWDWDLKTDNVYFSPRWKSMLGYEIHEVPNRLEEWANRVHPDDKEQAIYDIGQNNKGITEYYENFHRLKHKNGAWVWIHDKGKTYFDSRGEAIRMIGTHTDVTNLKQSEKQKELLVQRSDILLKLPKLSNIYEEKEFLQKAQIYAEDLTFSLNSAIFLIKDENIDFCIYSKKTQKNNSMDLENLVLEVLAKKEEICINEYKKDINLSRFIFVPVFEDGKIVMIYFLANKQSDYTNKDKESLQLISNEIWRITQNKRRKISLDKNKEQLIRAQKMALIGSFEWDIKKDYINSSSELNDILEIDLSSTELTNEFFINLISKDDISEFKKNREKLFKDKNTYTLQYRITTPKGNQKYIKDISEAILDEEGNILYIFSTIQDITAAYKKNAEIRLLKKAIENSPLCIVITDTSGDIVYVNPYFLEVTGYSYDEVLGKNTRILKSDYTSAGEYKDLWNEISNGNSWSGVFKNKKKDNEEYWESAIIVPIDDENGNIINYLGIKQEITKEIKLKKELEDKDKIMIAQSRHAAMGEMISMIAHQWRQPISIIAMGANNILADIELDILELEQLKKDSVDIIEQTKHLSKTIDDFRNFFKPNKDVDTSKIEDIFNDAYAVMGKSLENNNIIIQKDFKEDCEIKTYSRELMQVLINLIKNSKEAMLEKGVLEKKINIFLQKENDMLCINLCDNGGGITDNISDKIFEPYFSTKDEKTGTGLGLYMSKIIIEKHLRGTLDFYNINDGVCFVIKLPILRIQK